MPKVTVTGSKNAKLIYIKDDNSLVEETTKDQEMMTEPETDNNQQQQSQQQGCQQQSNEKRAGNVANGNKTHIKISRLPQTPRKQLVLLPKNYAINVIQYKLQYSNFHKENALYRKSTHILPWELMGKISDEVLGKLLEEVVGELEVNPMLENLYNAEFQY